MPQRRRLDPAGLPDHPNLVTDPTREAELVAEFRRGWNYLIDSYRLEQRLALDRQSYNRSLARLRKAVGRQRADEAPMSRLSPWLKLAINMEARELAGLAPDAPLAAEHGDFVRKAVVAVAARAKACRGKPGHVTLQRYVDGMMALIQETVGKPVMAMRDKDSVYDPQVPGAAGKTLRAFVDVLEPGITDSELSYWVRRARQQYAGKPMRFQDMFRGYGMAVHPVTGVPEVPLRSRLTQAGSCTPIYCP